MLNPDKIISWIKNLDIVGSQRVIAGIDEDDCAVIDVKSDSKIIITTDYLNSNPIAIQEGIGGYWDLGRLLVAANLADLYGSGAEPIGFLAGIMMKKPAEEKQFKEILRGIIYELNLARVPLIGGDSKLGNQNSFLGTAIGVERPNSKLFLKNGAKVGDIIFASGELGSVSCSLKILEKNIENNELVKWAKEKILTPNLPDKVSEKISKIKIGNGGTDISDGLCADLLDMCKSSGVGATLEVTKIPVHKNLLLVAEKLNIPPWMFPLTIGGDFQFIFTCNKRNSTFAKRMGLSEIGFINEGDEIVIKNKDKIYKIPLEGHEDSRNLSFREEVDYLINLIKDNVND